MRTREATCMVNNALCIIGLILCLPVASWSQTVEWTVYDTANSGLPYNGVTALALDAQGNTWVGTGRWYAFEGGGLAKFDGATWTVYNTFNSELPNDDHTSLSIDAQGNIWSGTEHGLSKFDGSNWTVYGTWNSGLPEDQLGAPAFDDEGNAWIGTSDGLAKFDGVNWTVYGTSNSGLPNNFIWPVLYDTRGDLWIGTFGSGLAKFDGADWTVYHRGNSGLPDNSVVSLALDSERNLWVGTYGGLARFDGVSWMAFHTGNSGLPHDRVWNLAVDPRDSIWAGTDAGLARFDGANWTIYNRRNSGLPDNVVYSLAIDAGGEVWIGTANGGLAVFRPRPVVDFNGNGMVDINDLLRLIESWGQDDPLCDIGPTAFGDGMVNAADLEVLMSYWGQDVQDSTLMAHWKLDETESTIAADSAADHDGTVVGTSAWRPAGGLVDGALEFDGTTCVVTDSVINTSDGPFSVFAWVTGGAPGQVILSQIDGVSWLVVDALTGTLATELAPPARRPTVPPLVSDAVITDDIWHRVAFVWDGATRNLYVDGVLVATDEQDKLEANSGGLCIGCGADQSPESFFTGLIDDVRIYNRAVRP